MAWRGHKAWSILQWEQYWQANFLYENNDVKRSHYNSFHMILPVLKLLMEGLDGEI